MWTEPTDLFVHPKTTALIGSASGFIRDLEGLPAMTAGTSTGRPPPAPTS
jgi:hypothetical protein